MYTHMNKWIKKKIVVLNSLINCFQVKNIYKIPQDSM
jgi:hypothetical protein